MLAARPCALARQANEGVTEVMPGLYLGDWNASFPVILKALDIKAILSISSEPSPAWDATSTDIDIPELGIHVQTTRSLICRCQHLILRAKDAESEDIYKYFQSACIFIDKHLPLESRAVPGR